MPYIAFLQPTHGASSQLDYISVTWSASSSANIVKYNVYRGTVHGGPYTLIGNTAAGSNEYSDYAVNRATTYYYVITATDGVAESVQSSEASATVGS